MLLPAAVRCDMVSHQAHRARHVRTNGVGGEVRRGVTWGVSCKTSLNKHVTHHLHREHNTLHYSTYISLSLYIYIYMLRYTIA